MKNLPLLQKTDNNFLENYLTCQEIDEAIKEEGVVDKLFKAQRYSKFILDIFPICLSRDSEEIKLLDSQYFIHCQFEKYENFFKKAFFANDFECGVYTDLFCVYEYAYTIFLDRLNILDKKDSFIFFHQILNLYPSKETNFIIKDEKLLKIFSDGLAGDYIYSQIFFLKYPITICQGYDLSLPIFFKNKKDITMYEKIANECGLFLRKIDK